MAKLQKLIVGLKIYYHYLFRVYFVRLLYSPQVGWKSLKQLLHVVDLMEQVD
jgi:hypothetical protein